MNEERHMEMDNGNSEKNRGHSMAKEWLNDSENRVERFLTFKRDD